MFTSCWIKAKRNLSEFLVIVAICPAADWACEGGQLAVLPTDDAAKKTATAALAAKLVTREMTVNFVTNLQTDRAAITSEAENIEDNSEDRIGSTAIISPLIQRE